MGGLAGYITEKGVHDPNRVRFLRALPTAEGETVRFCTEGSATFLYAGETEPITQHRGEQIRTAAMLGQLSDTAKLRDQLRRRGHTLYTDSDVELVLISYIEWGKDAPEHFSGDFSLAVWDGETLFLARSPSGRKALYYTCRNGFPTFASDPAVLFAHPDLSLRLSLSGAVMLLCPQENAICEPIIPEGIEALQPGEHLLWRQGRGMQIETVSHPSDNESDLPSGDFLSAFENRLRQVLSSDENRSECFLSLCENDPLAEWIHAQNGGAAECRKLAIWEEGGSFCPDATTITGEDAALGLTELVTALGRVDFAPDEAAAFRLCRRLGKSFSSAVSAAGGYLLLGGCPQRPISLPSEWLVPELQEIAGIPTGQESPERLLQRNLRALFERNDRLASHAGLRLVLPFADPTLARICRRASRQALAELSAAFPSPRFWPYPDGNVWAHGIESRFRALSARSGAPIWQLCCRDALPAEGIHPDWMAKLVAVDHWLSYFRIAPI